MAALLMRIETPNQGRFGKQQRYHVVGRGVLGSGIRRGDEKYVRLEEPRRHLLLTTECTFLKGRPFFEEDVVEAVIQRLLVIIHWAQPATSPPNSGQAGGADASSPPLILKSLDSRDLGS